MLVRKFAVELAPREIGCVMMSPGWVKTDMGRPEAPLEPEESIAGMLREFEVAPSGAFAGWDGVGKAW